MDNKIDLLYLSQEDLIDAGCFDVGAVISEVENVFATFDEKKYIFPDKVVTIFDKETQNRINCLPSGVIEKDVYGMKWVSVFPTNPHKYNCPNLSSVILLSDMKTGFPLAFMDGTLCSNLRTAAVSAVATKYLAKIDSSIIGLVGAGEQIKSHFMMIKHVLPSIKVCKVASRTVESEKKLVEQLSKYYNDVEFICCNNSFKDAVVGSDVIVSAISGQEKIIQSEWISSGMFYCHVAGLEDDFSVPKKANKIVCDDWSVVKHRTQTISQMYQLGLLKDDEIYCNLEDLVKRRKVGRENNKEFIYFNTVGLSYIDISLAHFMYEKAKKFGKILKIKSDSMFNTDYSKIKL